MNDSLSYEIIEAIADAEGVDPLELSIPLYDAIHPEALDSLFRDTTGHLTFEYHDYLVTVDHEGTVEVASVEAVPAEE
jgi:hypothetical protein